MTGSSASFVGLPVICSLQDQVTTVEGTVSSIDAIQGSITLESGPPPLRSSKAPLTHPSLPVTIRKNGQFHNQVPIRVLSRAEVAGLALLSTQKASLSSESSQRSHHSTPRNNLPSPSSVRSSLSLFGAANAVSHRSLLPRRWRNSSPPPTRLLTPIRPHPSTPLPRQQLQS